MAGERIAVDFGNAQTKIYKLGAGLVLSEPTVAVVSDSENTKARVIGTEAKKLIGKTASDTKIIFPVLEGEIVSEKVASKTLSEFLKKTKSTSILGVKAVMSVPCGANANFLKKLESVATDAGITHVDFVEAPILSALGQGLTLTDVSPYFIIDMGAGNTNIAAVSLEGIIAGISVNIGGNNIDTAIIDYLADAYGLQVGIITAEKLKIQVGSLVENDTLATVVNGRDVLTGKPRSISVKASDIKCVLEKYYDKIVSLSLKVLAKLPPEVSAEIRHAGIYVSGGSASVYGLEEYFTKKFSMQVTVAENPSSSVVFGGGVIGANQKLLDKLKVVYN